MTCSLPVAFEPLVGCNEARKSLPARTTVAAGECAGRLPSRSQRRAGPLDAAGAMTDNFRGVLDQEVDHPGGSARRHAAGNARPAAPRGRGAARVPEAARPGRRCRPPQDRARPPRRRAAAPGRARGQPAARATVGGRRSRRGEGAPRRDGARRAAGAGRDGAARAADLPAAARGGRPRRGAALGGGERRRPCLRRGRGGRDATRPRSRATVYLCCLEALERAGDGARATVTVRDEEGALAFEVVEDGGRLAMRDSTGCATASRRSAAG